MKSNAMKISIGVLVLAIIGAAVFYTLDREAKVVSTNELHLFNWGDYTNPELIKKFESQYGVKVTLTDYDSNDTALAKVKAGGHGYDLVVPSANYMPIWIEEGLLLKTRPDQMSNFHNMREEFADPEWDPKRHYSVPWLWGTIGPAVDISLYSGDINTAAIYLDPPDELKGKINVVPEMGDVIGSTIMYLGGELCTTDKPLLKRVRDVLVDAKQHWISMDYDAIEKLSARDIGASLVWNGMAYRARKNNPDVRYGYPREGFVLWMDSVAVLKDAKNVENAKLFQNFIMAPENAALLSEFAAYANGIKGSEKYMSDDIVNAPEINIPKKLAKAGQFMQTCSPAATKLYTAIWTELQK